MRFLFDQDVPDDMGHVLRQLQHEVILLRTVLPKTATDPEIFAYAADQNLILVTCSREDYVALARSRPNPGLIVLFRRKSRAAERAALVRLLASAGDRGLAGNVNYA